ncbi:hypothetical protein [Georgenia alba]|uniref:DUF4229 domain-containing protein n=1 Tax=Georgenia alba TaxID=2233858 RepID=A0ABW2Q911_9MICO
MSMPRADKRQQPNGLFLRVVMIEGAALAAVTLLYVFDVIENDLFVGLITAVALLGGSILAFTLMRQARRTQQPAGQDGPAVDPGGSTVHGSGASISGTGPAAGQTGADAPDGVGDGYDPMRKYRSPNA